MAGFCQDCGTRFASADRFCGSCGAPLEETDAPAGRQSGADGFSATLASEPSPAQQPPSESTQTSADRSAAPKDKKISGLRRKQTLLAGYTATGADTANARRKPEGPPDPGTEAQATSKRTMLGMSALDVEISKSRPDPDATSEADSPRSSKTMFGVQDELCLAPNLDARQAATRQAGMHGPNSAATDSASLRAASAVSSASATGNATPPNAATRDIEPEPSSEEAAPDPVHLPGVGRTKHWWMGLAVVVVFALGLGGWLLKAASTGPAIEARYVWLNSAARLEVQAKNASDTLQVKYKEHVVTLQDGRATIELHEEVPQAGVHPLEMSWRKLGNDAWRSISIDVHIPFYVYADEVRLTRAPPELRVVVVAPPESKVWLDGRSIARDGNVFARSYTLKSPGDEDEQLVHHSEFKIELPDGQVHQGTFINKSRIAYLQMLQPRHPFVTDQDTIVIRGKVHDGASVELDGSPLQVRNGVFHSSFRLPEPGKYAPTVSVSEKDAVARKRQLHLQRVDDIQSAGARFDADAALDYQALTARASAVQGHPVSFKGYVYHSTNSEFDTQIQVLLEPCPAATKCPAWVTYPAKLDVGNRSWYDIRGYADGMQKFKTQDNRTDIIPRIRGAFVLPSSPDIVEDSEPRQRKGRRTRRRRAKPLGEVADPWR